MTATGRTIRPDDSWLANYQSTNEAVSDHRFPRLIDDTAPRFYSDMVAAHGSRKLRDQFASALGGAPQDVRVAQDRSIALSACEAHNCGLKAFLWVNPSTGSSVGALSNSSGVVQGRWEATLLVFSRSETCRSLPATFWNALDTGCYRST